MAEPPGVADLGRYLPAHEVVPSQAELAAKGDLPPWLGDPDFHERHRSALLTRAPDHYGTSFPGVPADLPYLWPASDRQPSCAPG